MAPLSKADLLVSYADNIIGAIKALTHRNYIDSVLGGLASIRIIAGVTTQTVTGTPTKVTGFNTAQGSNGAATGCVADNVNNELTADVDGTYRIDADFDFSGTNSRTFHIAIYKDTGSGYVDAVMAHIKRKLGTGGDVGSSHLHDHLVLSAADKVTCFVWSSDGGTSFTPEEATFSMKRVG